MRGKLDQGRPIGKCEHMREGRHGAYVVYGDLRKRVTTITGVKESNPAHMDKEFLIRLEAWRDILRDWHRRTGSYWQSGWQGVSSAPLDGLLSMANSQ